ncbi:DNA-processing protein DprA [Herbihabitans rhizosphaerae]|uniref:DNA-processing protein DprA n=1 Tax=Herbihabitans rhizosphaerae TaxID=1872711 RepID=UPI001F5FF248|nr:DNA-processing protein DprA [Herbihabitans rhizosphaerae]
MAEVGSARQIWESSYPGDLFGENDEAITSAAGDIATWRDQPYRFLTFMDADYPAQLRDVHEFPPVLFSRGRLRPNDAGVSVVGSRAASDAAVRDASEVARLIVDRGLTVISGLAAGIDAAAHEAALAHGGRTVAVIGTGIERYYPAANRDLQDRIAHNGLLLSQFWPNSPPTKLSFPLRNATMSAYGKATVIVEAGEKSGARIQARVAVAHGRPVILMKSVVLATEWGRALRDQPGVTIADSPDEAAAQIDKILLDDELVARLLTSAGG